MSKSKVLVLMTGSIACYKVAHVLSRLSQRSCEVQVVASPSALQFIGNATIEGLTGRPVVTDMYASGNVMDHIHLMRWADVILVAPATANFINKTAQGVGDDLLTTLFLAHDFKKPFLVAPAMNTSMYLHPVTQNNITKLRNMGIEILETGSGVLACGEHGQGRLIEPDLIVEAVMTALRQSAIVPAEVPTKSAGSANLPKVLITSGGTQEAIDSVRVITNLSSGKTGRQIAEKLDALGAEVYWMRAHSSQDSQWIKNKTVFTDFKSLSEQMHELLSQHSFTHVIHAAAVSDYSVDRIEINGQHYKPLEVPKLSSDAETMSIHLKKNPKLVDQVKAVSKNKDIKLIAFKLTSKASSEEQQQAVNKLIEHSHADYVVHNDLTDIDIVKGLHPFTLYSAGKAHRCADLDELVQTLAPSLWEEK